MDSCQAPGRSCQHLNFCFPGKTEHFYWLRTKELCWEASAVSFNFFFVFLSSSSIFLDFSQHLLNFCLDFLSSFKNRAKIQMFLTQNEPDTDHVTRKIGPLYFTLQMFAGIYRDSAGVFCNICRENPVIFTDFPCNIYRLQKLQGKFVNITRLSLQILQKTPEESL